MTAIGFTAPIFIMIGAVLLFNETMRWERWLAAAIGFAGVLIVVGAEAVGRRRRLQPGDAGLGAAVRRVVPDHQGADALRATGVILLWQAISVTLFSLPLALLHWQWPTPAQWAGFVVCGLLGSTGHYCLTRRIAIADISATQSVKFLDLSGRRCSAGCFRRFAEPGDADRRLGDLRGDAVDRSPRAARTDRRRGRLSGSAGAREARPHLRVLCARGDASAGAMIHSTRFSATASWASRSRKTTAIGGAEAADNLR